MGKKHEKSVVGTLFIENPFIDDLELYQQNFYRENKLYLIDKANKITLYEIRRKKDIIEKLPAEIVKMWFVIIAATQDRADTVYLNKDSYCKSAKISNKTFYKCINELTELKIIQRHKGKASTYWINPAFFYAGNRLKSFPDNITKI